MINALLRTAIGITIATTATALSFAAIASPASAAEFDTPRIAMIATHGIDLGSTAGRTAVAGRVRQAAQQVCGANDADAWKHGGEIRACTANAIAAATRRVAAIAAASQLADATTKGATAQ